MTHEPRLLPLPGNLIRTCDHAWGWHLLGAGPSGPSQPRWGPANRELKRLHPKFRATSRQLRSHIHAHSTHIVLLVYQVLQGIPVSGILIRVIVHQSRISCIKSIHAKFSTVSTRVQSYLIPTNRSMITVSLLVCLACMLRLGTSRKPVPRLASCRGEAPSRHNTTV
jgi:hypothetical protein